VPIIVVKKLTRKIGLDLLASLIMPQNKIATTDLLRHHGKIAITDLLRHHGKIATTDLLRHPGKISGPIRVDVNLHNLLKRIQSLMAVELGDVNALSIMITNYQQALRR
jgi:hypothetical protein